MRAVILAVAVSLATPADAGPWSSISGFFSRNAQYQGSGNPGGHSRTISGYYAALSRDNERAFFSFKIGAKTYALRADAIAADFARVRSGTAYSPGSDPNNCTRSCN